MLTNSQPSSPRCMSVVSSFWWRLDEGTARPRVCVVAHPKALLARLARDHTDDRGSIVGLGAVTCALIGASAWRVTTIAMGCASFPRVLVQRIGLEGGASHHLGWGRRLEIGLETWPQGMPQLP